MISRPLEQYFLVRGAATRIWENANEKKAPLDLAIRYSLVPRYVAHRCARLEHKVALVIRDFLGPGLTSYIRPFGPAQLPCTVFPSDLATCD